MTDRSDIEELFLPDDLRALDEELRSIRYEERPSFGPELRAELSRAWLEVPARRPVLGRYLAAAAMAGLMLVGASVPSARASLVRLLANFGEEETPAVALQAPPAEQSEVRAAVVPEEEAPEAPVDPVPEAVPEPDAPAAEPSVLEPVRTYLPEMLDRERAQLLLEEAYPARLQRQGIGGVVGLRLWVDTNGMASLPRVTVSSGVPDLDRAAVEVAPLFRFSPAIQGGSPVATWIDLPVTFEPNEGEIQPMAILPAEDPLRLPILHPDARWEYDSPLDLESLPAWVEAPVASLSTVEAELVDALGDPIVRRSLGPIESILSGTPPEGRDPVEWRAAATAVLEEAAERDPSNPAPLLALGRIRLRQGLRTNARMDFEQGLQMAVLAVTEVSPAVVADLHLERGRLIREGWLSSHEAGRVHAYAFDEASCPAASTSGGAASGFASVERLLAWNYLCPTELTRVFAAGFERSDPAAADLSLMMGSFRAAIEAEPGHEGANVALLVTLADEGRWEEVLQGARRFARRSGGHPKALLLAGLALQRIGKEDIAAGRTLEGRVALEASDAHFTVALERLPQREADAIQDVSFVIDGAEADDYRRLWGDERRAWEETFWRSKDRTPSTTVNERRLEHLARSTFALLRFGSVTSDPGEVWVRFGGPNRVHLVDEGAGKLTEFWDYGSGPDITFVRWVSSQTMDLTPEGRAYVDDLGKIFPPQ